jgi:hypothetical protein
LVDHSKKIRKQGAAKKKQFYSGDLHQFIKPKYLSLNEIELPNNAE